MNYANTNSSDAFSSLLKGWRHTRKMSQLELALLCGASQKHISFLESGRSNPSRLMIFSISESMDIPLRDRNELLLAAGFAPKYKERGLDSPELDQVRHALDRILEAQAPYPAIVFDRMHNILAANSAATKLQAFLYDTHESAVPSAVEGNLIRGLLHPRGYGRYVENWEAIASIMLRRLRAEMVEAANSQEFSDFFDEVLGYPNIPPDWVQLGDDEWRQPVLSMEFEKDGLNLSMFSTLTSLGAAFDITLHEMRIESYFPMNQATVEFFGH